MSASARRAVAVMLALTSVVALQIVGWCWSWRCSSSRLYRALITDRFMPMLLVSVGVSWRVR